MVGLGVQLLSPVPFPVSAAIWEEKLVGFNGQQFERVGLFQCIKGGSEFAKQLELLQERGLEVTIKIV